MNREWLKKSNATSIQHTTSYLHIVGSYFDLDILHLHTLQIRQEEILASICKTLWGNLKPITSSKRLEFQCLHWMWTWTDHQKPSVLRNIHTGNLDEHMWTHQSGEPQALHLFVNPVCFFLLTSCCRGPKFWELVHQFKSLHQHMWLGQPFVVFILGEACTVHSKFHIWSSNRWMYAGLEGSIRTKWQRTAPILRFQLQGLTSWWFFVHTPTCCCMQVGWNCAFFLGSTSGTISKLVEAKFAG